MTTRLRNWLAVLGIAALLLTAVAFMPSATSAANLTGGNYTYLINGEEVTFTFDPVIRKEGMLFPVEVFQQLGFNVGIGAGKTVTVSKDDMTATVTIGSTGYDLANHAGVLPTPPLRLSGRIFLPADLIKEFGIDVVQDGNLVVMQTLVESLPPTTQMTEQDWTDLRVTRGLAGKVRTDTGVNINADFILMNADIINAENLGVSYGTRARLMNLLRTNTLVLVRLSNVAAKSGGLTTSSVMLVDDNRRQYEVSSVLDIGYGLLSAKLAAGADRMGVLVFPKIGSTIKTLSVFYDGNNALVGSFPVLQ